MQLRASANALGNPATLSRRSFGRSCEPNGSAEKGAGVKKIYLGARLSKNEALMLQSFLVEFVDGRAQSPASDDFF